MRNRRYRSRGLGPRVQNAVWPARRGGAARRVQYAFRPVRRGGAVPQIILLESSEDEEISNAGPYGPPDGFQFVLPYLDLSSRLNVETLNKSLREAVKDPLLWVDLRMQGPAGRRFTNEILLKLVGRADGHMRSLFLVDAYWITNNTMRRIFELNPGLQRVSVPGCTGLNVGNFVSLVEAHSLTAREKGLHGIVQVQLRGLANILPEHLLRLENALGVSRLPNYKAPPSRRYYGRRYYQDRCDSEATDKRPVDVELCPDCKNVKLLYNCVNYKCGTQEACRGDNRLSEDEDINDSEDDDCENVKCGRSCRSCINCIPRCEQCGACVRIPIAPGEESLCSDLLCSDCRNDLRTCDVCERPVCSLHEEDYFPRGADSEQCPECHDGWLESMGLKGTAREHIWPQ